MGIFNKLSCFFKSSGKDKSESCCDKKMREDLSEKQIDKTVKDSFPASDPPSTY